MKYYSIEEMRALNSHMNRKKEQKERTSLKDLICFFFNISGRVKRSGC